MLYFTSISNSCHNTQNKTNNTFFHYPKSNRIQNKKKSFSSNINTSHWRLENQVFFEFFSIWEINIRNFSWETYWGENDCVSFITRTSWGIRRCLGILKINFQVIFLEINRFLDRDGTQTAVARHCAGKRKFRTMGEGVKN